MCKKKETTSCFSGVLSCVLTACTPVCTRARHEQMSVAEQGTKGPARETKRAAGAVCGMDEPGERRDAGLSQGLFDYFFLTVLLLLLLLFRLRCVWKGINQQAHTKFLLLW